HIEEKGRKEISGEGRIISPPLVESHIHLDSALTVGKPWSNESGTLLEAIDIWSHYKKDLSKEALVAQAEEAVKWLIANGVLKIRAHTDSTDPTLQTIEAILEVKEKMQDYVDIQVVAFPQDGIFAYKGMDERLEEAIKMG